MSAWDILPPEGAEDSAGAGSEREQQVRKVQRAH